jgi:hypothetical protein
MIHVYANIECRCCGKALGLLETDGHPIHTRCIPKHWDKHAHGINASRCREFGKDAKDTAQLLADYQAFTR